MLREKFDSIIEAYTSQGFQRGMEIFIESLNDDLEKEDALSESAALEAYLDQLVESVELR